MKMHWRICYGAMLSAVLAVILAACQTLGPPGAQANGSDQTAPARRGTLLISIDTTGNMSPRREIDMGFDTAGRVKAVHVQEGNPVEAGENLMELDTADLEMEAAKAALALSISEAQLAKLRTAATAAEVASAEAAVKSTRENLAKVQEGPTKAQLAAAEASLKAAQDSYERLLAGPDADETTVVKADLEKAQVALKQAQAEYDRFAWRQGFEASPQAAALQQATIDYERALANSRMKTKSPTVTDVQNALAQIQRTQDELDRLRDSPTSAEVAAAQVQVAQAEQQLDQLTRGPSAEDVAIAEAQVEQAQLSLQQIEHKLEQTRLTAPFAGIVTGVNYEVGDLVQLNMPAVSLADLSTYQVVVLVDETDVAKISAGQRAEITLDSYPGTILSGTVRTVAPKGSISQGVVNFPVTVDLIPENLPAGPGPEGLGVLPQMTANVRIVQQVRQDVLLVPLEAIRREGTTEYVLVSASSGQPRRVEITAGFSEGDQVEVEGDLQDGDRVLLASQPGSSGFGGGFGMMGR